MYYLNVYSFFKLVFSNKLRWKEKKTGKNFSLLTYLLETSQTFFSAKTTDNNIFKEMMEQSFLTFKAQQEKTKNNPTYLYKIN